MRGTVPVATQDTRYPTPSGSMHAQAAAPQPSIGMAVVLAGAVVWEPLAFAQHSEAFTPASAAAASVTAYTSSATATCGLATRAPDGRRRLTRRKAYARHAA
jgi:hypothetical protein